jgi:CRISPR system Cascade subunit CasD
LRFGVRIDQPGQIIRDFQTARPPKSAHSLLSYRFYLSDAIFLAAVSGDMALLHGLDEALQRPQFPLYLGRRSCPPVGPISLGVDVGELEDVLRTKEWLASAWHRKRMPETMRLEIIRDARPGEQIAETIADEPIPFDPARRQHAWRSVVRSHVQKHNPDGVENDHDPFALVGG